MLVTSKSMTIHVDMISHYSIYYRSTREGKAIAPQKIMTKTDFAKFLTGKKEESVEKRPIDRKEKVKELFKKIALCDLNYRQEEIVQSLEEYFEEKGYISKAQEELLLKIYEELD